MLGINKNIGQLSLLAAIIGIFVYASSCTKIDTRPILEISVVNTDGQPVAGVMVALFDDKDQWSMRENPVQAWRETNGDGIVVFLDLQEKIYYFYADADTLSNIGHEILLQESLKVNEIRKVKVIIE